MELTAAEARVLGCLIEQEAAAPDTVPLTLNALRLSCNRSYGRDPVVAYDDRTVEDTLLALKSRGLARFVGPTSAVPTTRYRHRADERWRMGPAELAVLAVLLLGGVQTVSEVRANVQRLHPHLERGEVEALLDTLAARTPRPFAARVGRRRGDVETRWVQVLTGPAPELGDDGEAARDHDGGSRPAVGPAARGSASTARVVPAEVASPSYAELVARVAELEARLAAALENRAPGGAWGPTPLQPPPPPPPPRPVEARARSVDDRTRPSDDLAERLSGIERRLARIEAELGALH